MRYDLVCIGDVMLDVLVPASRPGERLHAPIARTAGGSAVNAALAAAAAGARVALVGRIGDDAVGASIEHELRAAGIEALLTVDSATPTGMVVSGAGTVADRGANATLDASHLPASIDAGAIFVSHHLPDGLLDAVVARADGAVVGGHPDTPLPLLNEDEALALTRAPDAAAAVRALAEGRLAACVTLAERGCVAARDGELVEVVPPQVSDLRALGAGDRFAAGFLLALAGGGSLRAAAEAGCASATRTRGA